MQDRVYKLYTVEEDKVHFSFEYPEELDPGVPSLQDEFLKTIGFYGPKTVVVEGSTVYRKWERITIYIFQQGEIVPSAENQIELFIKTNTNYPGFRILKKYKDKISEIEATVLYDSFSGQLNSVEESFSFSDVSWSIFFEHNGYIWRIEFRYPVEMSAEAKVDFEHMLKTFKMLD
jgi:hypothetical protein